jgi:hypothetical protein
MGLLNMAELKYAVGVCAPADAVRHFTSRRLARFAAMVANTVFN